MTIMVFALEGLSRGFFIQLFDIAGFALALLLALLFYPLATNGLSAVFHLPKITANPIGFLLIWLFVETIFFAIFDKLIRTFLQRVHATTANRYLGFLPSVVNGLLFLAFVLLFVVSLPIRPDIKKDIFDSKIGSQLVEKANFLEKPFNSIFGPITKQGLTFLTVKPEEKGAVNLEFKQDQLTVDTASEKRMFDLVNAERQKQGIKPLVWDDKRAQVGRMHSEDMFRRGYFSHYSPEGKDVGDRLEAAGISYTVAGENLALAPDVSRAHTGLMNSEGHRRNILDPAFHKIGIGAIDGGVYGKMFTQVFTD